VSSRPAFTKHYPNHPELDALIGAFVAGNFARVRRDAAALADKSDDKAVRAAARDLRRRIEPSPFALYLLALGTLLLLFLFARYLGK
jgi:hypothetical protein